MIVLSNLAFDCADAARVASFWRQVLRYDAPEPTPAEMAAAVEQHPEWAGRAVVDEEQHRHPRLYLQTVPEPRTGVNRVRPIVAIDDAARLTALGARKDASNGLRDIEGNEFRIVAEQGRGLRFVAVEIEALDPIRQAKFWAEMLGFSLDGTSCHPPESWLHRVPHFPSFVFVAVYAPKERKNRIHFDFMGTPEDGDHERLLAMGACDLRRGEAFVTMQDPEGNEFDLPV